MAGDLRTLWNIARLAIVGMLLLLEPIVKAFCCGALLLGVFAAFAFELSSLGPRFPFLAMLSVSLGFGVVLILYYAILALLTR